MQDSIECRNRAVNLFFFFLVQKFEIHKENSEGTFFNLCNYEILNKQNITTLTVFSVNSEFLNNKTGHMATLLKITKSVCTLVPSLNDIP